MRLLALTLAAALPLTAIAQEVRPVSGAATYRARIALPPGAALVAEATAPDGAALGHLREPTDGAQVPLPFRLGIPAGPEAQLRLAIFTGGIARWVSAPVTLAAGISPLDLGDVVLEPFHPLGFSTAWDCGGTRLAAGFAAEQALLRHAGGTIALSQKPAASGARYVSADHASEIWTKGDSAMVTLGGTALPECRAVPPDAAADWTARGNEPGWTLAVSGGRMAFVPFGAPPVEAPLAAPGIADGDFVHEAAGLRLTLTPALCRDTMTGMPYPETVTVETRGQRLSGCGGRPLDLLTGAEWVIEELAGTPVADADGGRPTLQVFRDGRIAGSGGCNRFIGRAQVDGERLTLGPAGMTMMACPEALMRQERRFLDMLADVDGFDIAADGALVLRAAEAPVIVARR